MRKTELIKLFVMNLLELSSNKSEKKKKLLLHLNKPLLITKKSQNKQELTLTKLKEIMTKPFHQLKRVPPKELLNTLNGLMKTMKCKLILLLLKKELSLLHIWFTELPLPKSNQDMTSSLINLEQLNPSTLPSSSL